MRQLKTSAFCLGKTDSNLCLACCCNFLLSGRSVFFLLSFHHLQKKVWTIFVSMSTSYNLLKQKNARAVPMFDINCFGFSNFQKQHNVYIFEWFYETDSYFADHRRRCTLRSNFRLNAPTETSSFCVGGKRVKTASWLFLQFFIVCKNKCELYLFQ